MVPQKCQNNLGVWAKILVQLSAFFLDFCIKVLPGAVHGWIQLHSHSYFSTNPHRSVVHIQCIAGPPETALNLNQGSFSAHSYYPDQIHWNFRAPYFYPDSSLSFSRRIHCRILDTLFKAENLCEIFVHVNCLCLKFACYENFLFYSNFFQESVHHHGLLYALQPIEKLSF